VRPKLAGAGRIFILTTLVLGCVTLPWLAAPARADCTPAPACGPDKPSPPAVRPATTGAAGTLAELALANATGGAAVQSQVAGVAQPNPQLTGGTAIDLPDPLLRFVEALNRGDAEAALASFTEDGELRGAGLCAAPACIGRDALAGAIGPAVARHTRLSLSRFDLYGSLVTGHFALASDDGQSAGVFRAGLRERSLAYFGLEPTVD
jgi:hypothetical protein